MDAERWPKQAWGPRVPASWFDDLENTDFDDTLVDELWWDPDLESISKGAASVEAPAHFVQPQARTLVMGDLNAVLAAQVAHMNVLETRST